MGTMTVTAVEDYLTSRVSGITVIDVTVEYPDKKAAFEIEGEQNYYLVTDADDRMHFTDGRLSEKLVQDEALPVAEFLDQVIKIIVSEE